MNSEWWNNTPQPQGQLTREAFTKFLRQFAGLPVFPDPIQVRLAPACSFHPGEHVQFVDRYMNPVTYTILEISTDGIAALVPYIECSPDEFVALTDERVHDWLANG